MGVVSVAEADCAVLASEEALVRDGDPMGIAPEVGEHLPGTAEGRFGVDHPVLGPELREERAEGRRLGERGVLPGEVELSCLEAPRSASRYFPRKTIESARTGKRKPRLAGIHRPSERL